MTIKGESPVDGEGIDIRAEIRDAPTYAIAERRGTILLDANELRVPIPAAIKAKISEAWSQLDLSRYPDPGEPDALRTAIAAHLRVDTDMVALGVGTSGLLDTLCDAVGRPGAAILYLEPGFSMYPRYAARHSKRPVPVPLDSDYEVDLTALVEALNVHKPGLIILPYPNNPTGGLPSRSVVEYLLDHYHGVLCIDEAYADYAGSSLVDETRRHSNLVVLRSFSKIGLAACRIGYWVASPDIARDLARAVLPYNMNALSACAARVLIEQYATLRGALEIVMAERERLTSDLTRLGLRVYPSCANFVLCELPAEPSEFSRFLLDAHGIEIRTFPNDRRLGKSLRVTVGAPHENRKFVAAAAEWFAR